MKNLFIGMLLALTSSLASAQYIKGTQLQEWMAAHERIERGGKNSVDFDNSSSAISYVTAVAESFSNMDMVCLPQGATVGQLVAVVGRYLSENPDKWNMRANLLTFVALRNAFPCEKK